jgi:predicted 3-demethylubiquinone-9 3-methyltransferase (glyoxalase superfamily)
MAEISRIRPFLWFDGQAQEAMEYYVSVFPNSSIDQVVL